MTIIKRRGDRILPEQLDLMCYWIKERESIRLQREDEKPPPWSSDPIMAGYRWCNARRMDDKVSRWLLGWHLLHPGISVQNRLCAVMLGRLINWPETLSILPYPAPYEESTISDLLLARKARGEKVFTGAYIVNGALRGDKILQVTRKIIAPIWKMRRLSPSAPHTMRQMWEWLNGKPGIGSFMAGQVTADIRYLYYDMPWEDKLTWAPQGPGSLRGVNRLIGQPTNARLPYGEWLDVVGAAYRLGARRLPVTYARLELMDQQNILCEYDKYSRLLRGEGTVRARYSA